MKQPRLIVTPYAHDGVLLHAYRDVFSLVGDNDWVCFMDGDAAFLENSDFGHMLKEYIDRYPNTGMFTCYASRCHYQPQMRQGVDMNSDSIKYIAQKTIEVRKQLHPKVKLMNRRVAGHLLMLQKKTWNKILPSLERKIKSKGKRILGFDTQLSKSLLEHGYDIQVMRGILVFHYLRFLNGKNEKIK